MTKVDSVVQLKKAPKLQGLTGEKSPDALPGWLLATNNDGTNAPNATFTIAPSENKSLKYLWFDILLHGQWFVTYQLELTTPSTTRTWTFSPLCECQTRMVFSLPPGLDLTAGGQVQLSIHRKTDEPALFHVWPIILDEYEPGMLRQPVLPRGPLLDALGRSTLHGHPVEDTEADTAAMVRRLRSLSRTKLQQPSDRSRWGGWKERRVEATGFFRTHHDGERWWLADPEGYLFWSSGLDCVHSSIDREAKIETRYQDLRTAHAELPRELGEFGRCYRNNPWHGKDDLEFNYCESNMIRAFGADAWYDKWISLVHTELRNLGFNTAGDWSDEYAARREGTPYTRALELHFKFPNTPWASSGFPDVFHPNFEADAAAFAENSLRETIGDPAMLGYFLHNEPGWHGSPGGVAAHMVEGGVPSNTRAALTAFLLERYGTRRAVQAAWGKNAEAMLRGEDGASWSETALADLRDFSTVMLEKLCSTLSAECRRVDPQHLNLGVRWWTFPPLWALKAMGSFDVISFNYYQPKIAPVHYQSEEEPGVHEVMQSLGKPFMIGEWHFGALDGGLPSAGLYRTSDQENRAKAFRNYLEYAASVPWCVGAHWFNMYDRNALSSTASNENYNIGLFDLTHQPHLPMVRAAKKSNERLYQVASGQAKPYDKPVEWMFPSR